ncbi:MAG: hypothetical protein JNL62_08090 [Bryobacterales bacterium]|nr:hypothetical protein [Bryobacterales bacterium]
MREEEFYVGYVPQAPAGVGRLVRRVVIGLLALAAALSVTLVLAQRPFAVASFEYGVVRDFAGVLYEHPFPHVVTADRTSYLLAGAGKHGSREVMGHDGQDVRLRGSRVLRAGMTMIEVETGSARFGAASHGAEKVTVMGRQSLRGEIVDGKCYLGVMNPGAGQVHRDCAARCLAGGLPALFVTGGEVLVLSGFDARNNMEKVGVPLTLEGVRKRIGGLEVLTDFTIQ